MNAGAERAPVILNEHNVIAVELGNAVFLVLPHTNDDSLDLLPPDCAQHLVSEFSISAMRFLKERNRK